MTLFPTIGPRSNARALPRDRADRRVPTGTPRLVDSSTARAALASNKAWQALIAAVRCSSDARLALLKGRPGSERVVCSWERITGCVASCRCGGSGTVTVDFLRKHYAALGDEISKLTRPAIRRSR